MNARKCDICGKFYECYKGGSVFKGDGQANGFMLTDRSFNDFCDRRKHYDLCQECMEKLMAFIHGREEPGENSN